MPRARPAFHWPVRIDTIPLRKVSELKADTLQARPTIAVPQAESRTSKKAGRT